MHKESVDVRALFLHDLFETSSHDLDQAEELANAIRAKFSEKILAYNCSPSFNRRKHLNEKEIASFQVELKDLRYKFQLITLACLRSLNLSMFELVKDYKGSGMAAYSKLEQREIELDPWGDGTVKHQSFVGPDTSFASGR